MVIAFTRTIILYLLIIAGIRLMGKRQVGELEPSELVLDFSGITFMDSAGIAVALRGWQRMRELGGCVELRHVAPQPKKVLEAAGLGRMMAIR